MRSWQAVVTPLFAVATFGTLAAAQTARSTGAQQSEAKMWQTPWDKTRPRDPFVDRHGRVWFVGQVGNYVANLDPKTGEFKRFTIEEGTHPHNLVVDSKGMVWFTGNANGRIIKMDPASGKQTTFMLDSGVNDPHTMTFDKKGDVRFTSQNSG